MEYPPPRRERKKRPLMINRKKNVEALRFDFREQRSQKEQSRFGFSLYTLTESTPPFAICTATDPSASASDAYGSIVSITSLGRRGAFTAVVTGLSVSAATTLSATSSATPCRSGFRSRQKSDGQVEDRCPVSMLTTVFSFKLRPPELRLSRRRDGASPVRRCVRRADAPLEAARLRKHREQQQRPSLRPAPRPALHR